MRMLIDTIERVLSEFIAAHGVTRRQALAEMAIGVGAIIAAIIAAPLAAIGAGL